MSVEPEAWFMPQPDGLYTPTISDFPQQTPREDGRVYTGTLSPLEKALMPTTRERVLDGARAAVLGDRDHQYGGPEDNFGIAADLWNPYWAARVARGATRFEPYDVAVFMDLLKTARIVGNPKKLDSWADKAGYSACGAEAAGAA